MDLIYHDPADALFQSNGLQVHSHLSVDMIWSDAVYGVRARTYLSASFYIQTGFRLRGQICTVPNRV